MMPELPEFELEQYLPFRFTVIAGQMSADLAKHYKAKFGISMPEWRVLLNVGYAEDLSIRDIEKRVSLEKSKVSRAASKLESKGYLTKHVDDHDRRLLKMSLTDEGIQVLSELIPIAQKYQAELEAKLGTRASGLHKALDQLSGGQS